MYTYEDWNEIRRKPFDSMSCGHCLTEHVEFADKRYACTAHPEVAQAVIDAVGPMPPLSQYTEGFDRTEMENWINDKLSAFNKLRERFEEYY